MNLIAQDVMTPDVITVGPETSVEAAAAELVRHHITCMPVLAANGNIVGTVSDADMIGKQGRTVADIMSTPLITVSPDYELTEVGYILKRVPRVLVVRAGELVGLISRSDLLKRIAQRWTCTVCGAQQYGANPPDHCTECNAPGEKFSLVEEPPMMYRDM
jgi:predicted transcriptional regulator